MTVLYRDTVFGLEQQSKSNLFHAATRTTTWYPSFSYVSDESKKPVNALIGIGD